MKQNRQRKSRETNLTEGPIFRSLTELALPIMASSFLGTAYNIMDMAWVGLLGANVVAGVGVGGMYVWLSQGLSNIPRMGGQVYAAQCIGQGKTEEARQYAKAAVQLVLLLAALFAFVTLAFTGPLVSFFRLDNAESVESALIYTRITCGCILFSYINVTLTGLYTAQGDSRRPLLANFAGLCMNMVLDPVLILGVGIFPRMDAAGAALATVLSQAVVSLVLILDIRKAAGADAVTQSAGAAPEEKEPIPEHTKAAKIPDVSLEHAKESSGNILQGMHLLRPAKRRIYRGIWKVGLPAAVQTCVYCMISMVLSRMIASFGAAAVAVQRVGGQIESITWNTADGFGSAMNAFAGQNYGAGKPERIAKGYRLSLVTVFLWGSLIMLLFLLFPEQISRVFFHEAEAVRLSAEYLWIIGFSEGLMAVELMTVGTLSGLGRTRLCSVISVTLTGMRIPLAMLLSGTYLGLNGIWIALTATSVVKGIVYIVTFYLVMGNNHTGKGKT